MYISLYLDIPTRVSAYLSPDFSSSTLKSTHKNSIPVWHHLFTHFRHIIYFRARTSPAKMKKHIVILGGSHAGISTAHRILKGDKKGDVKFTLVSPNTHHYWNIASPRGILPGELTDDQLFRPIAPGFSQYGGRFEFVLATAESVDFESRRVQLRGFVKARKPSTMTFLFWRRGLRL
jgi:hypothetical protein